MPEKNDFSSVADLYDTYVPATYDLDFFLKETKPVKGPVLELMAGTGRVSLPLIQAGVDLTCEDISADMLAVLREKLDQLGLCADLIAVDVCQMELGKTFRQVIIPFNSFAHLATVDRQWQALERIHRHLVPGGELIVTLANPSLRRRTVDGHLRLFRKYPLADQGTLLLWLLETYHPEDENVVDITQFFETYDETGLMQSRRLLELQFRITTRGEFEELARSAGFSVSALYGDYAYSAYQEDDSPAMVWKLTADPAD